MKTLHHYSAQSYGNLYMETPYNLNCEILAGVPVIPIKWMVDIYYEGKCLKQNGKYET